MKRPPRPKRGQGPTIADRPPFQNRRFRKTAEEIAHEYRKKLLASGWDLKPEEVLAVIRGTRLPRNAGERFVADLAAEERRRGVVIL